MESHGVGRRLWIGNLDPYLTEYSLLRLFQNFGVTIKNFNIVYHRNGPEKGKSKGYCFVTVATDQDAQKLIKGLDSKHVMGSRIQVKHALNDGELKKTQLGPTRPVKTKQNNTAAVRNLQIKRIEDKLKSMENDNPSTLTKQA